MPENVWLSIALLVGPLVGAVVGFGLQLHSLRQATLNHDKLKLEVEALHIRAKLEEDTRLKLSLELEELKAVRADRLKSPLVQSLSTEEVVRFAGMRFSRRELNEPPLLSQLGEDAQFSESPQPSSMPLHGSLRIWLLVGLLSVQVIIGLLLVWR